MIHEIAGTACETCRHIQVCKFQAEFLDAQNAVNNAVINFSVSKEDGKTGYGIKYLKDIDYIQPIKLQCKHYENKHTSILRSPDGDLESLGGV